MFFFCNKLITFKKKKGIRQELQEHIFRQESVEKTRILSDEAFLALSDKILSTRISQEGPDLFFFQARILYRRNGRRISADNQENQEYGKIVD